MRKLLLVLVFLSIAADAAVAATIHVPGNQPTIQAGIAAAAAGDTVLVAAGTYYEYSIAMTSGVYLASETGLSDCVTIDAQQQDRVFYCDGVSSLTSIVGFTITGGRAFNGGGMYCSSSSPALTNCTFTGNEAEGGDGGGMCCYGPSSPALTDCTFTANTTSSRGGGMYCDVSSSPTLTGCTFTGNQAYLNDGGGGVYCMYSSPTLTGCTLTGNLAYHGGGMYCDGTASPTLTDCTLTGNLADYGGGMHCHGTASPTLTGCTLTGNLADHVGGGMYCYGSCSPVLMGCTFTGNQANGYGAGVYSHGSSSATLTNCIIAFGQHGEAIYCADGGSAELACCDVYGNEGGDWVGCIALQYGVDGNLNQDPLFCDIYNDDTTLCANSPCLPGGNGCGVLIGAHGPGCAECDAPALRSSWGSTKAMFR